MSHINTGNQYPGILGLLYYKPSTGAALGALADALLRGPSNLTRGERELIAAYVSKLNECDFCQAVHGATADVHLGNSDVTRQVWDDCDTAALSPKMKALLAIAAEVRNSGHQVGAAPLDQARAAGAVDEDIHDTVLIAAAFCMFNRYVDGLDTPSAKPEQYPSIGKRLVAFGYKLPPAPVRWLVRRALNKQFGGKNSSAEK